jgi:hypothetical protein
METLHKKNNSDNWKRQVISCRADERKELGCGKQGDMHIVLIIVPQSCFVMNSNFSGLFDSMFDTSPDPGILSESRSLEVGPNATFNILISN